MYRPFGEDFLGPEGNLGIDFAGEAVDICMMPASEFGLDTWNWLTVLVDNGHGWFVKIYSLDFIGPDPENPELVITVVHTTDLLPGTPYAIDVDNFDMELHVLYYYDSVYSVARWQNMEW